MDSNVEAYFSRLKSEWGFSEYTIQAYRTDLLRFLDYWEIDKGRSIGPADFNNEKISKFLGAEERSGRLFTTVMRRMSSLRKFGDYLVTEKIIKQAPNIEIEPRTRTNQSNPNKSKIPKLINRSEVFRVTMTIKAEKNPRAPRDLAIFMLLLETGISIGHAVSLDVSDIDISAGCININNKAADDPRSIPISDSIPAVSYYLKLARPELSHSSKEYGLFVSQMGTRMTRQAMWQVLKKWGKRAGLTKSLTPRLLRHTATMRLISEGHSVTEIQALIGHRNPFSTRALLRRLKVSGQ